MELPIKKNKLRRYLWPVIATVLTVVLILSAFFFSKANFSLGMIMLIIPFLLVFIVLIFLKPEFGFWSVFVANYFVMGISRYFPGPLGLAVDGLLVLTWLAVFFSQFNKEVDWRKAWNSLTLVAVIWYIYALFQLFNPAAVSRVAWFYAMRGVSLYMLLTIPLVFLIFNKPKHLNQMLKIWAWFTLLGVIKGLMQKVIGPDPWEQHWIDVIGGKTHLLSQGLRIFSFFTDASTYGGSMAYSGVVFSITAFNTKSVRKRWFFVVVAIAAFYGMLISGTRGAIAVPFAGFTMYAILSKKVKIIIIGAFMILGVYGFLKLSTFGNSIYEIRRIRGALNPDNPSLVVRKENQKLLKSYLITHPFGGGIGSAGNWGLRFSPDTFLAQTPTDSWYVQIWAEQGRVGLYLHISILIYIIISGAKIIMFRLKTPEFKGMAAALLAGMFGVMAASYGSGALGQMPNGIIVYISMAFIFKMPEWEKIMEAKG